MSGTGFRVVGDVEAQPSAAQTPPASQAQAQQATRLLLVALGALSQKAVIAVASLFSLALAGSVWWLAMTIEGAPSDRQLIGMGLYALFVLALHYVKRRG